MKAKEFNTGDPLGYLITWTAYGTWLPGDERGWQRKGDPNRGQANALFRSISRSKMKEPAFLLILADRELVVSTVQRHCEIRRWTLHAVNARSNHVHVVVTAPDYKPETVRNQFKARCTRKLKEIHQNRKNFWAEGGSRRWLNTQDELDSAIVYVNEVQD